MYDTDLETRGPYYVPWKKTSMDLYNKIQNDEIDKSMYANTRYKSQKGYIEGSTIGNVPLKKEEKESEDSESDKKTD